MTNERMGKFLLEHTDLTPDGVVAIATPKDSLLHGYFEWDDSKAGHEHRKNQARGLLRGVKIYLSVKNESMPISTRQIIRDPDKKEDQQGYAPFFSIKSDRDKRVEAILRERRYVVGSVRRMRDFLIAMEAFEDLETIQEIEKLLMRLGK